MSVLDDMTAGQRPRCSCAGLQLDRRHPAVPLRAFTHTRFTSLQQFNAARKACSKAVGGLLSLKLHSRSWSHIGVYTGVQLHGSSRWPFALPSGSSHDLPIPSVPRSRSSQLCDAHLIPRSSHGPRVALRAAPCHQAAESLPTGDPRLSQRSSTATRRAAHHPSTG